MKKRSVFVMLIALLCLICALALVSCDKTETADGGADQEHVHAWGEWTTSTPATCTQNGSRTRSCTCGESEVETIVARHNYVNRICIVCNVQQPPTEGLAYTAIHNDTAYEVSGIGTATDTDILIPDIYNGKPVTGIGESAFEGIGSNYRPAGGGADDASDDRRSLTSITIPKGVTSIGECAFSGCRNMVSVVFDKNSQLTSIGDGAFWNCESLTSITIPEGVTSIGYRVFLGCNSLTSIVFPSTITDIGDAALSECYSLTSITIPSSVRSIGEFAFIDNIALNAVYYGGSESDWSGIAIGSENDDLISATRYYYSEAQPTTAGKYWHYDNNNQIVIWPEVVV